MLFAALLRWLDNWVAGGQTSRMATFIRPAIEADLDALLALAISAGPGLTNLPADKAALADRIARSDALLDGDDLSGAILLLLEVDGQVRGTGMVFPRTGVDWPFYSYRIGRMTQRSSLDGRMVRFDVLTLVNDLEGATEVGGLMIDPALRGGAYGRLMARSRYLLIARDRARFADRTIADLRGYLKDGTSPFWDAVGGRFYAMDFAEADRINGITGNQFIADLGPRHPIYTNMLPDEAQAAIGRVHDDGRAAVTLLAEEGFIDEGYVDIFDAGPTLIAATDALRGIGEAHGGPISAILDGGTESLIATGHGRSFRATRGRATDGMAIDPTSAATLGLTAGDDITHFPF
ncbi:arginine N-succinyltransferase [Sphingomonas crocodyli]|uniref:Arginine N-succinyltransferase n=1 Tax=Sphingomonas crocodyli TaxID=1979270 RepID=A0A437M9G0_9SPHN|nr:arginine N-succinyltransferase [Sphingomonas crocodyli]RVT94338.1 arginine N-succinyltransferase [Sphingomonas crocodyli]